MFSVTIGLNIVRRYDVRQEMLGRLGLFLSPFILARHDHDNTKTRTPYMTSYYD